MVCNICNCICDSCVTVLEFLWCSIVFFSAVLPRCFYIMHFKSFYRRCWLRFVFITTKNIIGHLCKLLFEVTKPWLICGYNGYKNHDCFGFYRVKPWLTFVREHGNSERILDELVVVKLLPTLKHVINLKKVSQDYECSLPESDTRPSYSSFLNFLSSGFLCLFTGIVSINYDHFAASMMCERSRMR